MKNKDLEKYIAELSPELQEKARQCKNKDELNELLAENDVELSEDALEAVAGGGSCSDSNFSQGDGSAYFCPECHYQLRYWDRVFRVAAYADRFYCSNGECVACKENWLFTPTGDGYEVERVK